MHNLNAHASLDLYAAIIHVVRCVCTGGSDSIAARSVWTFVQPSLAEHNELYHSPVVEAIERSVSSWLVMLQWPGCSLICSLHC